MLWSIFLFNSCLLTVSVLALDVPRRCIGMIRNIEVHSSFTKPYERGRGGGGSADVSYLNHPVMFARGEALFPQNGDAGVEPALVVRWGGFLLLLAEAHLWIDNNNNDDDISYTHNISQVCRVLTSAIYRHAVPASHLQTDSASPKPSLDPESRLLGTEREGRDFIITDSREPLKPEPISLWVNLYK